MVFREHSTSTVNFHWRTLLFYGKRLRVIYFNAKKEGKSTTLNGVTILPLQIGTSPLQNPSLHRIVSFPIKSWFALHLKVTVPPS